MYKTSILCAVSMVAGLACAYTHQEYFSQFGRMLDEFDTGMWHHRARFFEDSDATSYSVKQTDNVVTILFNTLQKISTNSIDVQTAPHAAFITVAHEGRDSRITLQQDKGYLSIGMCTRESHKQEVKNEQRESHAVFSGSSCTQQVIPIVVDFDTLEAEYAGTQLKITVRLQEPTCVKTKKVSVVSKEQPAEATEKHSKKHKQQPPAAPVLHEK